MGANESSGIQVNFNHSNLFYFAGEQIAGNISFQNREEKLKLDSIFLECIGEIGYTTQEISHFKDKDGHPRTEQYIKYHQVPFLSVRVPIAQPQYGQNEITLYRGQYSWPFEFVLPAHLPPSLIPAATSYPYVKYYTRIVLDKPWYKPNAKETYPLTIFPRANLLQMIGGQHQIPFSNQNRKKIQLQGYLYQAGVVPGDKLSMHLHLKNPKRSEIKRIEATLIQHRQIARTYHAETIFRLDLSDLREFSGTELQRTFDLMIPGILLSPTYTYMSQHAGQSIGISVHYELVLDVKVRGLFTDFKVHVPVVIGTVDTPTEQQPMNHQIEMPEASAPMFDYDEPPPSYESVVTDHKM